MPQLKTFSTFFSAKKPGQTLFSALDRFRSVRLNLDGKVQAHPTLTGQPLPMHGGNILHLGEMHMLGIVPHLKYFLCNVFNVECPHPKHANNTRWLSRATSASEVTNATGSGWNTIPFIHLLEAKSEQIGVHALSGGSGVKVVSYALRRNTVFNILHLFGAYIMLDARQIDEKNLHYQAPTGESAFPECEYSIIRSIPPCLFLGYQEATFGLTSFRNFIFNELYVDINTLGADYFPIYRAYHDSYQDMITDNWKEKGLPTYTGAGPSFTEEAFERFIKLNLDFYAQVNRLGNTNLLRITTSDQGNEKMMTPHYNLENLEQALRKTFGAFVTQPALESSEHNGPSL